MVHRHGGGKGHRFCGSCRRYNGQGTRLVKQAGCRRGQAATGHRGNVAALGKYGTQQRAVLLYLNGGWRQGLSVKGRCGRGGWRAESGEEESS